MNIIPFLDLTRLQLTNQSNKEHWPICSKENKEKTLKQWQMMITSNLKQEGKGCGVTISKFLAVIMCALAFSGHALDSSNGSLVSIAYNIWVKGYGSSFTVLYA